MQGLVREGLANGFTFFEYFFKDFAGLAISDRSQRTIRKVGIMNATDLLIGPVNIGVHELHLPSK